MRARGEDHYRAKLSAQDVLDIRRDYARGPWSLRELGEIYGVSKRQIGNIVNRTSWAHVA